MLRRNNEALDYFKAHAQGLREHIDDSWRIDVDYDLSAVTERKTLPERVFSTSVGPFTLEDFDRLGDIVLEIVDYTWTCWQVHCLENVKVEKATGSLFGTELYDVYRKYWYDKDGAELYRSQTDTCLFFEYRDLARKQARLGNTELAAQYSQVCINLASNSAETEREVLEEFGRFAEKWNQLTAQKENCVKKHATLAREGFAEYWRIEMSRLGRQELIMALSPNYQNALRNLDYDSDRAELLSKSRSNPYRRGFELTEKIAARLGSVGLSMWGILTEWPLEELRLRVPACAMSQLQKNSLLAPDRRAVRLAEIGDENRLFLVSERGIDDLRFLFDQIDGKILGIGKLALTQLAVEKGK